MLAGVNESIVFHAGRQQAKLPKQMRAFTDSQKSKKTVASMIERKGDKEAPPKKTVKIVEAKREIEVEEERTNGMSEEVIIANRRKLAEKLSGKKKAENK